MTISSKFKSRYSYYFITFLGFVFVIRDYVFSLNNTRKLNWDLNLFSNLSDQLLWLPFLPIIFKLYEKYPFIEKRIKSSLISLLPYIILISFTHRFLTVIFGKFAGYHLDIISLDSYERVQKYFTAIILGGTVNDILFITVIIFILYLIQYYEYFKSEQIKNLEISKQLNNAQIQTLKMQLQPHFLFNSLNTVSSVMEYNTESAQNIVSKLASFLRYSLEFQSQKFVPLSEEIEFTKTYLDIEIERFSERLNVEIQIEEKCSDLLVPTFILQPIVENTIKHAINMQSEKITLFIHSKIISDQLVINAGNTGSSSENKVVFGLGLSNIRDRLSTIYGSNYTMNIDTSNGFSTNLFLPLEKK